MTNREIADHCIAGLNALGMDKAKVIVSDSEARELCCHNGAINMLRTTCDACLHIAAIKDNRKGALTLNKTDRAAVDNAVKEAAALAESSNPEEANDISEWQPAESFRHGAMEADENGMYERMAEFLACVKTAYPNTGIRESSVRFHKGSHVLKNSNGVDYTALTGCYEFAALFSSREGDKVSSFNYTFRQMQDLDAPFIESANLRQLLKQSGDEINARPYDGKFIGDVIITPECLGAMIGPLLRHLGDYAHITGASLFKDKLGAQVASNLLTIRSNPVSDDFAVKSYFDDDGYKNENVAIIEAGVLQSNLLTLFGAKKTGQERAKTNGSNLSVDPGNLELSELIRSTGKGLLLARFSGGNPNDNGDFSGIAKNSYLIEDGVIQYPVKEVMVTGNLLQMIRNIVGVSEEVVHFGFARYPWVKMTDFTISGK